MGCMLLRPSRTRSNHIRGHAFQWKLRDTSTSAYLLPPDFSMPRAIFLGPAVLNRVHLRSRQLKLICAKVIGHVRGIRRASKGNHF
jgi:hypothetical protein